MEKSPERLALEEAAKKLKVSFAATIGDEKLQERVDAAKEAAQGTGEETPPEPPREDSSEPEPSDGAKTAPLDPPIAPAPEVSKEVNEQPVYLDVIGPQKGFWRSGRHFGAEKTTIPVSELSDAQLTAILDEPRLIAVLR